ncbi:cysteine desulfurase mitochondrial-like [Senna tora]|uniref:Cysteine desulfurase mitochondrial-like n=1 Tax=Senna tora TaxID=362788 RepID=A0A834VZ45_9FABA|nr:cysteine desulfurase mitochondrial-like [Senna tora]
MVLIDEEDVANGVEKFRRVLIGKLISTKQANLGALENAFRNIWRQPRGFKGEKTGHNLFLFHFNDEEAMNREMEGGPWSFRNRWLVLLTWRCGITENDKAFSRVKLWVQIWGAPLHCRTEKVARKLCAALGKVFEVGLYEDVTTGNVFMKWLEFELKNCLRKGMNMGNPNDGIHCMDLRYEKIPKYCAKCGYFGHDDDKCELEKMALKIGEVFISKYLGSWFKDINLHGIIGAQTKPMFRFSLIEQWLILIGIVYSQSQRFEQMWTFHDDCANIVSENWGPTSYNSLMEKLVTTTTRLIGWNKNTFGNIHRRIRKLQEGIEEVYMTTISQPDMTRL